MIMSIDILNAVRLAFSLYEGIIIIRVFMSWLPISPYSKLAIFVTDLTDPFLGSLERFMPGFLLMPLNFTPIVALFLLSIIERFILRGLVIMLYSVMVF